MLPGVRQNIQSRLRYKVNKKMHNTKQVMGKIKARIKGAIRGLPGVLGNEAVNFSLDRFKEKNWLGASIEPWPAGKKKTGSLLVKSGRLRRSIRIINQTENTVTIGTDVPYARAHNYGIKKSVQVQSYSRNKYRSYKKGTGVYSVKTRKEKKRTVTAKVGGIEVRQHTRRMFIPKRQFLGKSPYLVQRLVRAGRYHLIKNI